MATAEARLIAAIRANDVVELQDVLDSTDISLYGFFPIEPDEAGSSCLSYCITTNSSLATVKCLIDKTPGIVNYPSTFWPREGDGGEEDFVERIYPLHLAIANGRWEIFAEMLKRPELWLNVPSPAAFTCRNVRHARGVFPIEMTNIRFYVDALLNRGATVRASRLRGWVVDGPDRQEADLFARCLAKYKGSGLQDDDAAVETFIEAAARQNEWYIVDELLKRPETVVRPQLLRACVQSNNVDGFKRCLAVFQARKCDIYEFMPRGEDDDDDGVIYETIFEYAVTHEAVGMVPSLILAYPAQPFLDHEGNSMLQQTKTVAMASFIFPYVGGKDFVNLPSDYPPLLVAINRGTWDLCVYLIKKGAKMADTLEYRRAMPRVSVQVWEAINASDKATNDTTRFPKLDKYAGATIPRVGDVILNLDDWRAAPPEARTARLHWMAWLVRHQYAWDSMARVATSLTWFPDDLTALKSIMGDEAFAAFGATLVLDPQITLNAPLLARFASFNFWKTRQAAPPQLRPAVDDRLQHLQAGAMLGSARQFSGAPDAVRVALGSLDLQERIMRSLMDNPPIHPLQGVAGLPARAPAGPRRGGRKRRQGG